MIGRILGLDAGSVRIGAAVSDPSGSYAMPIEVIDASRAVERITQLVEEYSITTVVVGLPLTLRNEMGPQAREVEKFVRELREAVAPLPVMQFDERLTSKEADRIITTKKGKAMRDAVAAAIMLEGYLNQQKRISAAS